MQACRERSPAQQRTRADERATHAFAFARHLLPIASQHLALDALRLEESQESRDGRVEERQDLLELLHHLLAKRGQSMTERRRRLTFRANKVAWRLTG